MVKLTEQEGPDAQGDRRLVLFAVYFDAKKTVAQGRKVSAAAASENPSLRDIAECLAALRIPFEFQDKRYSRDPILQRGRLRVLLRNEEDVPLNPEILNRKALYANICRLLKQHPERLKRTAAGGSSAGALPGLAAPAGMGGAALQSSPGAGGSGAGGSGAGGSASKKSGKKGRK